MRIDKKLFLVIGILLSLGASAAVSNYVIKRVKHIFTAGAEFQNVAPEFPAGLKVGATGSALSDSFSLTQDYDFPSDTDGCTDSNGLTKAGVAVGDICTVAPPASPATDAWFTCHVSAANTVKIRFCAHGTVDPSDAGYSIRTFSP